MADFFSNLCDLMFSSVGVVIAVLSLGVDMKEAGEAASAPWLPAVA